MQNILNNVEDLLELTGPFEPIKALNLCEDALSDKNLTQNEQETLALQRVRCAIHCINLEGLYGYLDEENYILYPSDSGKPAITVLEKYIFKLIKFLNPNDHQKIIDMYVQVQGFAQEWLERVLPIYIGDIVDAETYNKYCNVFQGFFCLTSQIIIKFVDLLQMACIKNVKYPSCNTKPNMFVANLLIAQSDKLILQIQDLAFDFPHFAMEEGLQASQLCILTEGMLAEAARLIEQSDLCDMSRVIACKKGCINLKVDRLNMIFVGNGHRSTLFRTAEERKPFIDEIRALEKEIQEYEPSYKSPPFSEVGFSTLASNKSSGGCYIATAVYGSYDCPQVWTLRRYRDNVLAETWFGRIFIALYYAISPTMVKWFGNRRWFTRLWKHKLDRMVQSLNVAGFENTPYRDKY